MFPDVTRLTLAFGTILLCAPKAHAAGPWITLFDGHSTSAWLEVTGKPFPGSWTVQDGALRTLHPGGSMQDICTVEEFSTFELTLEFKLEDTGNSGLKYRVQKRDEWNNAGGRQARARGLEFQLAGPLEPDGRSDPRKSGGSLYSLIAPTAAAGKIDPDGYHRLRLVVQYSHAEHWLDGVRVLSYDIATAAVQEALQRMAGAGQTIKVRSPICLQNHSSPAWFRNIRIRRLD